ncbi:aspartate dehydrogenase [Sporosarcina siberiensis]|uniref:L-aspartate dehydrogenase n=1 Tax=Sporosarcina siberiensis TaxID=1365606 RepID=A0ABW4SLK9_9BACL
MKIGIIGTGNIAKYLLENINKNRKLEGKIVALFGRNEKVGQLLAEQYNADFFTDFKIFINSEMDIVVEAATIGVTVQYIKEVLESKKDVIISSIGAFNDNEFLKEMKETAQLHTKHIYLPSGAIGGLDLLQSANSLNGLKEVSITTRKSPESLGLEGVTKEQLLFDGSARDAIEKFPQNMNVALLLSIAGIGAEKTRVRVLVDPTIERNTHTIEADGDFGTMLLTIENNPMPDNPKTSYLAALSILSTLQNKNQSISIGS